MDDRYTAYSLYVEAYGRTMSGEKTSRQDFMYPSSDGECRLELRKVVAVSLGVGHARANTEQLLSPKVFEQKLVEVLEG